MLLKDHISFKAFLRLKPLLSFEEYHQLFFYRHITVEQIPTNLEELDDWIKTWDLISKS